MVMLCFFVAFFIFVVILHLFVLNRFVFVVILHYYVGVFHLLVVILLCGNFVCLSGNLYLFLMIL